MVWSPVQSFGKSQWWWAKLWQSNRPHSSAPVNKAPLNKAQQSSPVKQSSWSTQTKSSSEQNLMLYVNDKIKAFEVIVIDEEDQNLGKMSRYDALKLSQERGLDLVQLSYNPIDKVCTAKIVDVGKYLYEKKKVNKEKKKTANKWMKQMKFAYGIGENDLKLKISKVREMLDDGYVVRVFVQLKWRENIYKDKVIDKLHMIQKDLSDVARSQSPDPKQDKNTYSYMFLPIKSK